MVEGSWRHRYLTLTTPIDMADAISAFCDEGLALQFSERHARDLRYVAAWGRWFKWTGKEWKRDDTLLALDLARDLCRYIARLTPDRGKSVASNRTIGAVLHLARADRRHASTPEQWDRNPWLLNTPDGTVDLRAGRHAPARPRGLHHQVYRRRAWGRLPHVAEVPGRITDEDIQLQAFLQRMAGYALTGLTRDHALFFIYGLGANGKSVFLNTLIGILGAYHRTAPAELLLASKHDRHPTELAGLVGCHLVTATETEGGRRWAETKIKLLTGGDGVTARFMGQDFFEFTPRFKLVWSGNPSPPSIASTRRSGAAQPCAVHRHHPAGERDTELTKKLKAEWPASCNG